MRLNIFLVLFSLLITTGCSVFKKTSKPLPKPQMVTIPGGKFQMGNLWNDENTDALPVHSVTIDSFYIGKYEVTTAQFNAYAKRTKKKQLNIDALKSGNLPAVNVTWIEAKAYCNYFGYRLPTEQEWEYAARGGGKKVQFSGTNNPDSLFHYAYIDKPHVNKPLPVGLKKPNALGLYDMSGNVFEWVGDYYQLYPKKGEAPKWDGMDERILRIIRGGSFDQRAAVASTYWRAGMLYDGRASDVGFRCASDTE